MYGPTTLEICCLPPDGNKSEEMGNSWPAETGMREKGKRLGWMVVG